MSLTTKTRQAPTVVRRRVSGGGLPTRARVRGQIIAGALLVIGAALVGALVFLNAGDRVSAVAVRGGVPAGHVITRDNLVSKPVAGVDDVIAVEDVDSVVGKTTTVALVDGQVLTSAMVTSDPIPATDQAMAGLALTTAQMPVDGLAAGDTVRLVATPGADVAATEELGAQVDVLAQQATVFSVSEATTGDAAANVTVVVSQGEANKIALYSAAGRVAVVKVATTDGQ